MHIIFVLDFLNNLETYLCLNVCFEHENYILEYVNNTEIWVTIMHCKQSVVSQRLCK